MKFFNSAFHFYPKTLLSTLVSLGILMSAEQSQAAVSPNPLNLVEGVAPNVLFTLDESGSMSWGYIPDADTPRAAELWARYNENYSSVNSRRYHSHRTNPQAYNPHIIYTIPPAFDASGNSLTPALTTSFTDAPINGFQPSNGKTNLRTAYKPIFEHRIPNGTTTNGRLKYAGRPGYGLTEDVPIGAATEYWTPYNKEGTSYSIDKNGNPIKFNSKSDCQKSYSTSRYTCQIWSFDPPVSPAYFYRFDGTLRRTLTDGKLCEEVKDDTNKGGEQCYRYQYVHLAGNVKNETGTELLDANMQSVSHMQNFAVWYSFYRSRALATLSAASIAFKDLSSSIRFSWQNLDTCKKFDGTDSSNCKKNKFQPYSATHRGQFYSWFRDIEFNVGTPLPDAMYRAGEFLKGDTAWLDDPTVGQHQAPNNNNAGLNCRPAYHILMTDGMWNKDLSTTISGMIRDDRSFTTPQIADGKKEDGSYKYKSGMTYSNQRPFYDSNGINLADIAMHYWATDLPNNLANRVPSFIPYKNSEASKEFWDPRNNPATWQHMSNFIMGLGLTHSLNNPDIPWTGETYGGPGYEALRSGSKNWPKAESGSNNNVYDLWHAAINSRGEFYSVDSPEDMVAAFKDIMNRISERTTTASLPAISSSVEDIDEQDVASGKLFSNAYKTSFDSADWSGNIEKIKTHTTYVNNERKTVSTTVWSAEEKLPAHGSRNIKTPGSNGQLVDFKWEAIPSNLQKNLGVFSIGSGANQYNEALGKKRLDFLRGNKSIDGEIILNTSSGGIQKKITAGVRNYILGDFLNSRPILVRGARMLASFAEKAEPEKDYAEWANTQKARTPHIYVGGNSGMLHAFNADTGEETFAFIPTAVYSKLYKLVDESERKSHNFYVDGTPVISDVYDNGTGKWRTILIGTLSAGGTGIFALDITNPAAPELLWELDETTPNLSIKPGHSFSRPTIARLHNGDWAVVTGNGYVNGDDSGKAALYIVNAISGTTKVLEVESDFKRGNGLSTPKLVDYDNDGLADYAYAGDLHGNLWRFDLLGNNAGAGNNGATLYGDRSGSDVNFRVSYGGKPMFRTQTSQTVDGNIRDKAITAAPTIIRHPNKHGYLVTFGTGRYFEDFDKGGSNFLESVYAIWDEKTNAEPTLTASIITDSQLLKQNFSSEIIANNSIDGSKEEARLMSKNTINWNTHKGWRLDLGVNGKITGEMMVNDMMALGSTLFFSTSSPSADPCAAGSGTWIYAINAHSGGHTEKHIFIDLRDSAPNSEANVIAGIKMPSNTASGIAPSRAEDLGGQTLELNGFRIRPERSGRQTWRLVPDP